MSDSYGITVDKVQLTSTFSNENLIANGDFETPALTPGSYTIENGGFSGWTSSEYELGGCKIYNDAWHAGQCIELDGNVNIRYTQVLLVDAEVYRSLIA